MSELKYTIGIDTGQKTGIGVWDNALQKLHTVNTTDFFGVEIFLANFKRSEIIIYVEIPKSFIYSRHAGQRGAVRDITAIKIGKNIREAELVFETLWRGGYNVKSVPPIHEKKWDQKTFEQRIGSEIKTNEHVRDAVRLSFYYSNRIAALKL